MQQARLLVKEYLSLVMALRSAGRKYLPSHEWVELDGEIGTVGITDFAQVPQYVQRSAGNCNACDAVQETARRVTHIIQYSILQYAQHCTRCYNACDREQDSAMNVTQCSCTVSHAAPEGI